MVMPASWLSTHSPSTLLRPSNNERHSGATLAWLARRSKLSSQRLARLTKRLFGLTPSQFITKSRIAAASRMLRDSGSSVAEIAHVCGFYDHSAFTRAFRSATGMTPSDFRTQQ